ncbi:unnamed protein product, partial [Phaeothamnion confervicola]
MPRRRCTTVAIAAFVARGLALSASPLTSAAGPAAATAAPMRVVVVGAGPAGAMTALLLARQRRGMTIDIFEARGEASRWSAPSDRSWNVVLAERGLDALSRAGVDLLKNRGGDEENRRQAVLLEGNVRHTGRGGTAKKSPFFKGSVSIERGALARALLAAALACDGVSVRYGHTLSDLCPVAGVATFAVGGASSNSSTAGGSGAGAGDSGASAVVADGAAVTVKFDLLVGADGVNSEVRAALERRTPGFTVRQEIDDRAFKTFRIESAAALEGGSAEWEHCFHVWRAPPGEIMSPPGADGSLTATVVLPGSGPESFETLMKSPEDVRAFFASRYPTAFGRDGPGEAFCAEFLARHPNRLRGIYCSRLSVGRVALVGDAAHSMWASLGQGVNAALETCRVFSDVLAGSSDLTGGSGADDAAVMAALERYDAVRRPDAHAVCLLSERGLDGAGGRTTSPITMARLALALLLNKLLPKLAPKPSLFGISNPAVRYSEVLAGTEREARRFGAVARAAAGVGAAVVAR